MLNVDMEVKTNGASVNRYETGVAFSPCSRFVRERAVDETLQTLASAHQREQPRLLRFLPEMLDNLPAGTPVFRMSEGADASAVVTSMATTAAAASRAVKPRAGHFR